LRQLLVERCRLIVGKRPHLLAAELPSGAMDGDAAACVPKVRALAVELFKQLKR
jgi:hypothetical protein